MKSAILLVASLVCVNAAENTTLIEKPNLPVVPSAAPTAKIPAKPSEKPAVTAVTATAKTTRDSGTAVGSSTGIGTYNEHDPMLEYQMQSAKKGFPQSQYIMALRYLSGNGVPKDETKARELLDAASKQGHMKARAKLHDLGPAK